jgi:outer membrane protein OmpA-like peptidoglycan-associated protein
MKTSFAVSSLLVLALTGCANSQVKQSELTFTPNVIDGDMDKVNLCPKPVSELYMVMPEEGKEGTVVVTFRDGREVTLHGDYSAMTLAGEETNEFTSNNREMKDLFEDAVKALPGKPFTANLYFIMGTDKLNAESEGLAAEVYDNVVQRDAPEVIISGHTDSVGTEASNQILSEKRAETIRQHLVGSGVDPDTIETTGYGESKLLVDTPDNTAEQLNRRVEINVR